MDSVAFVSCAQEVRRQSGYGFVHYSITGEGIHAAIRAASSLDDITVESVNYKCSLSHNLNKYLTGELTMPAEDSQIPGMPPQASGNTGGYSEDLGLIDSDYFFQSSPSPVPPPQQPAYGAAPYRQASSVSPVYNQNQAYNSQGLQQAPHGQYQQQQKPPQYNNGMQGQQQQQAQRMQQQGYRPPPAPQQAPAMARQPQRPGMPAGYTSIHPELAHFETAYEQRVEPQYNARFDAPVDSRYKTVPPQQTYQQQQQAVHAPYQQQQQQHQQFSKPYYPEANNNRDYVSTGQAAHSVLQNAYNRNVQVPAYGAQNTAHNARQVPYSSGSATLAALSNQREPVSQAPQYQQPGFQPGLRQAQGAAASASAPTSVSVSPINSSVPGPAGTANQQQPAAQRWSTGSYTITPPEQAPPSAQAMNNGRPSSVNLSKAPVSSVIAPRQQQQNAPQHATQQQNFVPNNNTNMYAQQQPQRNFTAPGGYNDFQPSQGNEFVQAHVPLQMQMQQQQNNQYQQQNNQYQQQQAAQQQQMQQMQQQQMFQQQQVQQQQQQQQAQSQFSNVFAMNAALYANNSNMMQAGLGGMTIHVSPPMSPLENYAASPLMPHNTALFNPFLATGFSPLFTTVQGQLSPYIAAATMSPMLSPGSMMPRDIVFEENISNVHNLFTPATFYQSSPVLGVRDLHYSPGYMHGNFTTAGNVFGHQNGAYVSQPLDLKMYANRKSPKTEARALRGGHSNGASSKSSATASGSANSPASPATTNAVAGAVPGATAAAKAEVNAATPAAAAVVTSVVAELRVDVTREPMTPAAIAEGSFFGTAPVEGSPLEKDVGLEDADVDVPDNTTTESLACRSSDVAGYSSSELPETSANAVSPNRATTATGSARRSLIMKASKQLVA